MTEQISSSPEKTLAEQLMERFPGQENDISTLLAIMEKRLP